jgi:MFS family permease
MAKDIRDITIKDKKERSLKHSIKSGSFYSIMFGFGESYVSPFAIALKATDPQIAFLSSIPQLASSISQLFAAKVTDVYKKRKQIILISTLVQSLIFFPLFIIPFLTKNITLLILFFTIYWIAGYFGKPAWNSWMGELIDENRRGRYFGLRNKIMGFFAFSSVFAAGFLLDTFTKFNPFLGFGVIFLIALVARYFSYYYTKKMYEPRYIVEKRDSFTFVSFLKRMKHSNYGRFVLFVFFFKLAVSISAPFFAVYMLRDLNFTYWQYTLVIGVSSVASFLTMTYWGRYGDKFGNKKLLTVSGLLIPLIPILWVFSTNLKYLFAVQAFSGFLWAGFNLSSANFIFDSVSSSKRARCNAYYNVFFGISIFFGATIGGYLAKYVITPSFFISNLLVVFIISGFLRLCFSLLFLPTIKEERKVEHIPDSRLLFNVVAVDPIKGLMYESATGMKVMKNVGEFGFDTLRGSVKNINKLVKDLDKAIKKRKELKEQMKFIPSKEKKFEAKELDYMIKDLNKKIKKMKDIKKDYLREPE